MTAKQRTQIVKDTFDIDIYWAARLAHGLQLQSEAHGGGADADFRGITEVVGASWIKQSYAKETEQITVKNHCYIVETSNDGFLYMKVLVGGLAMTAVYIVLSESEVNMWKEFGDYYLEKISIELSKGTKPYSLRTLI